MHRPVAASPPLGYDSSMSETTQALVTVLSLVPVSGGGKLLALADVEVVIDGIQIVVHGVQVRGDGAGTEVTLPRYRAADGTWRAAVSLPEELKGSMGDVVLAAGIEQGILKQREMA